MLNIKLHKEKCFFHLYFALFFLSYLTIYVDYNITKIPNFFILGMSYYLIIFKKRVEPVLLLMIFTKPLVGLMFPTNKTAFSFFNIAVNFLPLICAFYFIPMKKNITRIASDVGIKFKFTILFLIIYVFYSVINIQDASYLFTKQLLPMVLFVLSYSLFEKKLNFDIFILFFRYTFISTIVVYLFFDYIAQNVEIMMKPIISPIALEDYYKSIFAEFIKNQGFLWDSRRMGILSFVYLYIILSREKINKLDVFISFITLVSAMSRGAIVTWVVILLGKIFLYYKKRITYSMVMKLASIFMFFFMLVSAVIFFEPKLPDNKFFNFLDTFNLMSKKNALAQRSGFKDYSLEHFYNNPLGCGIGELRAPVKGRKIPVGTTTYSLVTDAFLFSFSAEVGIFGMILFLLSFFEILFNKKHMLSFFLVLGVLVQLTGTDIPDMRLFYFVFLILIHEVNISKISGRNICLVSNDELVLESNEDKLSIVNV